MDERVFSVKAGQPIPDWDAKHRLSIDNSVGPECKDSATIHRMNETFMDVSEQPHMIRHWLAGGALTALLALVVFILFIFFFYIGDLKKDIWLEFSKLIAISAISFFSYTAWDIGRDELFSLTRRPIRFNRVEKKIVTIQLESSRYTQLAGRT